MTLQRSGIFLSSQELPTTRWLYLCTHKSSMVLEGETRLTLSRGTQAAQRCSCELSSFMSSSAGRARARFSAAPLAPGLARSSWKPWNNGWFVSPFSPWQEHSGRSNKWEKTHLIFPAPCAALLGETLHIRFHLWLPGLPWGWCWTAAFVGQEIYDCIPNQPAHQSHAGSSPLLCFSHKQKGKQAGHCTSQNIFHGQILYFGFLEAYIRVCLCYSLFMLSYWFIRNV